MCINICALIYTRVNICSSYIHINISIMHIFNIYLYLLYILSLFLKCKRCLEFIIIRCIKHLKYKIFRGKNKLHKITYCIFSDGCVSHEYNIPLRDFNSKSRIYLNDILCAIHPIQKTHSNIFVNSNLNSHQSSGVDTFVQSRAQPYTRAYLTVEYTNVVGVNIKYILVMTSIINNNFRLFGKESSQIIFPLRRYDYIELNNSTLSNKSVYDKNVYDKNAHKNTKVKDYIYESNPIEYIVYNTENEENIEVRPEIMNKYKYTNFNEEFEILLSKKRNIVLQNIKEILAIEYGTQIESGFYIRRNNEMIYF